MFDIMPGEHDWAKLPNWEIVLNTGWQQTVDKSNGAEQQRKRNLETVRSVLGIALLIGLVALGGYLFGKTRKKK